MKVKNKKSKTFEPITLEITIETPEELCDLWHRLNKEANAVITKPNILKYKAETIINMELWKEIDNLVVKNNLKLKLK